MESTSSSTGKVRAIHNQRVRAQNITPAESEHLLTILEEHKMIIENKKTDKVCVQEKTRAWESVARQYNATTCSGPRSVHNLQNAYKNLKKKTKKAYASEKMTMPLRQDVFIETVEEVGEDWAAVSQAVGATDQECKVEYVLLKEEAKKELSHDKKAVMGTGGGPPECSSSYLMDKVKGLIGPAIDGLYTQYDGDRFLAGPEPFIEHNIPQEEPEDQQPPTTPVTEEEFFENKRGNLKKKKNILLKTKKGKGNASVTEKFKDLADHKSELVRLQIATAEIKYQDAVAQFEHNEKVRAIELAALIKKVERNEKL